MQKCSRYGVCLSLSRVSTWKEGVRQKIDVYGNFPFDFV